jgi:hypothetical protein
MRKAKKQPAKKQPARNILCECKKHDYKVRSTQQWIEPHDAPHCPVCVAEDYRKAAADNLSRYVRDPDARVSHVREARTEGTEAMSAPGTGLDRYFGQVLIIGLRHWRRFVVRARAAYIEQVALAHDRHLVLAIDQRFALGGPNRPSAPDKKSRSMVSSPTFACR